MKPFIIALRVLATILLIGILYTQVRTPGQVQTTVKMMSLNVDFRVSTNSDAVFISSALIGFLVSLVATGLSMRCFGGFQRFRWPFFLALISTLSLVNELTRLAAPHIQVLIYLPAVQVVVDWFSVRKLQPPSAETATEHPAATAPPPLPENEI